MGVRHPELVRPTPTGWQYRRYVSEEATLQGGFLPVFWDVPKSTMHAVSDVGALVEWLQEHIVFGQNSADNLAVLHNQNHMVHEFGLSAWVTQSGRQVISRSVPSCAGNGTSKPASGPPAGYATHLLAATPLVDVLLSVNSGSELVKD